MDTALEAKLSLKELEKEEEALVAIQDSLKSTLTRLMVWFACYWGATFSALSRHFASAAGESCSWSVERNTIPATGGESLFMEASSCSPVLTFFLHVPRFVKF